MPLKYDVRIILVNTSHPGNIGSVARAMKTMGLSELYLVAPKKFPDPEATALAVHASDILDKASVVSTLPEALETIQLVYGTSANTRAITRPIIDARTAAQDIASKLTAVKIAIVFGPENHGLSNHDLQHCHYQIQIPTAENYHSLNLAAALQIIAYELHMANSQLIKNPANLARKLASFAELESYYEHLRQTLITLKILDPEKPRQIMQRLRELYQRAQLDSSELKILRGILKAIKISRRET